MQKINGEMPMKVKNNKRKKIKTTHKKVKSPSKKQRKQASQSSGGYSSLDSLQPGARGHIPGPK